MKKVIISLAVVCVSFLAHAATCNWSGLSVSLQSTTDKATSYAVYLLDASTISAEEMSALLSKQGVSSFSDEAIVKTTTGIAVGNDKMRWAETGFGNYEKGTSWTFYTVIFNNDIKDATYFMITDEKTVVAPGTGAMSFSFGTQAANTWQSVAVPEPTSGLLLLLGMAGLALKRKHI